MGKPLYKDVRRRIGENVSGRQSAPGPDSPSGNSGGEREAGSGGGGGGNGADKGGSGGGSGDGPVESGSSGSNVGATDPTGSKAYASHLKENSIPAGNEEGSNAELPKESLNGKG